MGKILDDLVAHYGEVDSKVKTLSKELESEKVTIKNIMEEEHLDSHDAGGYTVTRVVSERVKVDEEKMLKILKDDWVTKYGSMECPYIKTKEYIDMDQLESVIYAGELSKDVMRKLNECQEKTEVIALKCGKTKKKKEEE